MARVGALGPQWEDQSSQGLLAGRILGHRQGHAALPSLPAIPVEMQVGRVREGWDPGERRAGPQQGAAPAPALTEFPLAPGGCHQGPGSGAVLASSPLRSPPRKEG